MTDMYRSALVGGGMALVEATPVLTAAGAYAIADYVGTSATAMTFSNCARVAGGTGIIVGAVLVDGDLQSIGGELWLFDTAPTPPNDNAAWTITDAMAADCIGVIPFSTYYASALNSVSIADNPDIVFKCGAATRNLYGCFVTRGAPTYTSLLLTFKLQIVQS